MLDRPNEYGNCDDMSVKKLRRLGDHSGIMVTGCKITGDQGRTLLKEVVRGELDHWVPDASQRLIGRASLVLGLDVLLDPQIEKDHGPRPQDHALIGDWVCGIYVMRCATCAHLFKV